MVRFHSRCFTDLSLSFRSLIITLIAVGQDKELCDHERYAGDLRTPKSSLAATVFSAGGPAAKQGSPRKKGRPTGWLSNKLRENPEKGKRMSVEKRVAAHKPDIYEIVDAELEKGK